MPKKAKILIVLTCVGLLSSLATGCSLLPYSSKYACPESKADMGNCSSLITNYKESFRNASAVRAHKANCPVSLRGNAKACEEYKNGDAVPEKALPKSLKNTGLISMRQAKLKYFYSKTPSPLRVPSSVKKILIMPYYTDNAFYGESSVFVIVKKGFWLYGEYFSKLKKNYMFKITKGE